jgi:SAM-dependent methyltransferase
MKPDQPRLYSDLASWFHLLTAPSHYAEEAEFAHKTITEAAGLPVETVLELGSGGGNNAFHLKAHFKMTLTDLSEGMLELSRTINPECEHIPGDMRSLRLGREFDAVFIHDAVAYAITKDDLLACMKTALIHCKAGGVVLFMPDFVKERFRSGVHHGGHDGDGRGLRYMEWIFDADPNDTVYTNDFVYMLREEQGPVRVEHDTHFMGIFSRQQWLDWLGEAGFKSPRMIEDPYDREVFVASK